MERICLLFPLPDSIIKILRIELKTSESSRCIMKFVLLLQKFWKVDKLSSFPWFLSVLKLYYSRIYESIVFPAYVTYALRDK